MNFKKFLISILIFTCSALSFAQKNTDKDYSYVVGAKDLLTINVFDVPELNITVRVSENGTITLPLLGQIEVDGLTQDELERKLASLLEKNYLKNAQVTVFIKEYQSKQVSVIGAVKKPGNYELIGKQTLLQMLSIAGGLSEEAADRIVVIRQYSDGASKSLMIDLDKLMIEGDPVLNIPIHSNDIINVPVEVFVDIYIFGQVTNAGQIKMKKNSNLTLLRAIAQAGGFTDRARKSGVVIKRIVDEKEVKIQVNVNTILSGKKEDILLNPNDIVFVPESIL
ncbi:MAG: polysaccharide export protein [Acidobacteria bacterium]|jgi:polysaccharide export outer membrane protein|nr:polysaccharide export protein [Acidobacteriota bacterium]